MDIETTYEEITTTSTKPTTKKGEEFREELLTHIDGQGIVIVHCSVEATRGFRIRIWDTTHLRDESNRQTSKLLHVKNISLAPEWTEVQKGNTIKFTMIFSALPKNCKVFDLIEDVHNDSQIEILDIEREPRDIYSLGPYPVFLSDETSSDNQECFKISKPSTFSIFTLKRFIKSLRRSIKVVLESLRKWWSATPI